jgi:hypothetical protein
LIRRKREEDKDMKGTKRDKGKDEGRNEDRKKSFVP